MSDIISEWLGFEPEQITELTEAQRDQAVSICKLVESPEWATFQKLLDGLLGQTNKPVEEYAHNPNLAHFDSGYKRAILNIKLFIENQRKLLEQYVKKEK